MASRTCTQIPAGEEKVGDAPLTACSRVTHAAPAQEQGGTDQRLGQGRRAPKCPSSSEKSEITSPSLAHSSPCALLSPQTSVHPSKGMFKTLSDLAPAPFAQAAGLMGPTSPMSLAFLGTMRRRSRIILMASRRISKRLLKNASNGARGKAATKMVVKLYWITAEGGNAECWCGATMEGTSPRDSAAV